MTVDAMTAAMKRLFASGRERGHVTMAELNAALPSERVSSEVVEDTLAMLGDLGIEVVEWGDPEDGEAAVAGPRKPLSPSPLASGAEAPLDGSEGRFSDATGRTR